MKWLRSEGSQRKEEEDKAEVVMETLAASGLAKRMLTVGGASI